MTTPARCSPARSWTTPCRGPTISASVVIEDNPVPTPTNPLGVKGAGEAGTVGSLSAGVNAIVDALVGARHPPHRHAVHAVSGMAGDQEDARTRAAKSK